ncbi:MAG: MucB/RseB C-terminal domain-containing protein [Steroidobacteraceae bacterium]|nr:MucB/RseB C-terminal domain-containing protein [Steroidobacteraceae bacterium]
MRTPRLAPLAGWWLVWTAFLFAAPAVRADADDPRAWLDSMNEALASRTYDGEFLHLSNGRVEKMRILHRASGGRISERLVSLSGSGREIVRSDGEVQCYLPDQRKVLVESREERGPLLGTLPRFDANVEQHYRLEIVGRARSVLGRPARIVAVTPRDAYRFGYRLWIDEQSRMPVRTDLCDAQGNVLEQVLFTSLNLNVSIPDAAFRPAVRPDGFEWVRQGRGLATTAEGTGWRLLRLPPGFRLSSTSQQRLSGNDRPAMHMVLSDGLASVSVFIETPTAARPAATGQGRVGSAFAYSTVVRGHQVTAVGEVPPQTVQFIASGVVPAEQARR